jgi:Xaa-Pro dipeptidase
MFLKQSYTNHVQVLQEKTAAILQELKLDALVIGAGSPVVYFEDDQAMPFRANHHFRHWCPFPGTDHLLIIVPGHKPRLRIYQPADFWHEVKLLEPDFWTDAFTIETAADEETLWKDLPRGSRIAYHGPDLVRASEKGLLVQVEGLLPRLNWSRLTKTLYEQQSLTEATKVAAMGHKAAERAFRQGGSELDVHLAYLNATRSTEHDLPYETIVALNEKAAFLHYGAKRDDVHNGRVLLIDAGAQVRGFAADITRTYATDEAPEEFRSLLEGMQKLQFELCQEIQPGLRMNDLHVRAHQKIAQLLISHRILLNCDEQKAMQAGLTMAFFPHGLGHQLGLLVHDVAGRQVDVRGTLGETDPRFPRLRTTRPLNPGTYVTIEPGIYFIKMLLDPFRNSEHSSCFQWSLIERLMPCGGIRIEDNVLVLEDRVRNITREFLPL